MSRRKIRKIRSVDRSGEEKINYGPREAEVAEVGEDDEIEIVIDGTATKLEDIEDAKDKREVYRALFFDHGYEQSEIADKLGISKSAVAIKMNRMGIVE